VQDYVCLLRTARRVLLGLRDGLHRRIPVLQIDENLPGATSSRFPATGRGHPAAASTSAAASADHGAPVTVNPIPQGNGGDQDGDNNGGPSDGDGNV
jgi:hypothetical protein